MPREGAASMSVIRSSSRGTSDARRSEEWKRSAERSERGRYPGMVSSPFASLRVTAAAQLPPYRPPSHVLVHLHPRDHPLPVFPAPCGLVGAGNRPRRSAVLCQRELVAAALDEVAFGAGEGLLADREIADAAESGEEAGADPVRAAVRAVTLGHDGAGPVEIRDDGRIVLVPRREKCG